MVDQKHILLSPRLGDLAEGGAEVFGLLAGVGEDQGFLVLDAVVHILVARVQGVSGGLGEGGLHHRSGDGLGGGEVKGLLKVGDLTGTLRAVLGDVVMTALLRIRRLRRLVILGVLDIEMLQTQPPLDLALL